MADVLFMGSAGNPAVPGAPSLGTSMAFGSTGTAATSGAPSVGSGSLTIDLAPAWRSAKAKGPRLS